MNIELGYMKRIKDEISKAAKPSFPVVFIWTGKKWIAYKRSTFIFIIAGFIVMGILYGGFIL